MASGVRRWNVDVKESAYARMLDALRGHGSTVRERGDNYASATCPCHDDSNPSLSITGIPGNALVWCHGGCDVGDVLAAVGLTKADLYDDRSATYQYDDGRTVKRFYDKRGKKRFVQTGAGETSVLYRRDLLEGLPGGAHVILVEGEADADAVIAHGGIAVTAPQGANSFHKVDVEPLRDLLVTVVVDRDEAGEKWAAQVADKLHGVAGKFRFVRALDGKDASDHLAAGHSLTDFEPMELIVEAEAGPRVILRKASDFAMKGVRWIYRGRIPLGMVTLMAGREGIGKSTVSLDIAARLTRGTLDGRYQDKPQSVVICASEDSWSHTIVPRLKSVNADMGRVYHIAVQDEDGNERAIVAPQDTRRMEKAFLTIRPALMLIDPLMAIIDGKVDTHKQADVQQALEPLVKMCERMGMSILALIHVNKSGGTDPLNNIMGSKAFATLPRSILYCIEEDDEYLFCHAKCNVGPKMPSIHYRLSEVRFDLPEDEVEEGDEPFITSSRVVWGEVDDRSATDVLQAAADAAKAPAPKGELRLDIRKWIEGQPSGVSLGEITAEFGHKSEATIRQTLRRMVKDEEINSPARGIYAGRAR